MSEKRYLLTESELTNNCDFLWCWCCCGEVTNEDRIKRRLEFLEAHEYKGPEWPPIDGEGQPLAIDDHVHMLRTEFDGDHEWEDVVYAFRYEGEYGGDTWVVMGEEGETWACECEKVVGE